METTKVTIPVMVAIPWDTEEVCINLEAGFVSQLLGLAQILKLYRAWDGTDEEIGAMMPQVEKGLAALMGGVCCDGVASVGLDKSGYMVSIDQDGNKTYVSNMMTSAEIENMPEEQSETNTDNNVCAGVNYLVDRLLADVLFSLDQAQFVVDQFKTAAEALTAIGNAIPLWSQSFGTLIDGWEEWAIAAADLTISTLKIAYSDPAVKNKLRENLYCNITAHVNNIFQESDYFAATSDLPLLESQSALLAEFFAGFYIPASGDIFGTVLRWYNLGSLNSDATCAAEFDCEAPPWRHTFDFTESDGGWTPYNEGSGSSPYAVYDAGVGWKCITPFGTAKTMHINRELPTGNYDYSEIYFSPSPSGVVNFFYLDSDNQAVGSSRGTILFTFAEGLGNSPRITDVEGAELAGARIMVAYADTSEPEANLVITKIVLGGAGTNPFI